jgi:P2 family phage contractile tail tube protein
MNQIPQFITNYRIYNNGSALMGVGSDLSLPNFESITETVSGAGILGEFETAVPGSFKSQQIEYSFRIVDPTMFNMASSSGNASLTVRASQQSFDYTKGGVVNQAVRIEARGPVKGIDLGKLAPGKPSDGKLLQEILFIAIYLDDKEVLCLDKLNFVYRINGVDMLSGVTANM